MLEKNLCQKCMMVSSFSWPEPLLLNSTQQHIVIRFSSQSSEHVCSDEVERYTFVREVGIKSEKKGKLCLKGSRLVLLRRSKQTTRLLSCGNSFDWVTKKKIIITSHMAPKEVVSMQLCIINSSLKWQMPFAWLCLACPSYVFPCKMGGESWTKESCALPS